MIDAPVLYHLRRAVMLLDAAAERERRREAGKPLRQITEQQRAKHTREFVAEMGRLYFSAEDAE